jgi:hypothetical protein
VRQTGALSLKQVTDRVNLVHQVLSKVMVKGTHYGTVPGCGDKLVLLKPGADVLAMTFRLVPQFAVTRVDLENGHREYDVTCSMYGSDGALLGQGVGSASTMEKKYRYRKDGTGNKIENEDIADVYNTVLKIAKKRSHIDATLTVTGAADLFTQDMIDEDDTPRKPVSMPTEKQPATTPATAEGVMVGPVAEVSSKSGKGARGEWTKYGVKIGDVWYSTFDAKIGKEAEAFKATGTPVHVEYKTNEKGYHDIVSLAALAQAAPAVDRDALLAEINALIEKTPASKVQKACMAAGLDFADPEAWGPMASDDKLLTLASLLRVK